MGTWLPRSYIQVLPGCRVQHPLGSKKVSLLHTHTKNTFFFYRALNDKITALSHSLDTQRNTEKSAREERQWQQTTKEHSQTERQKRPDRASERATEKEKEREKERVRVRERHRSASKGAGGGWGGGSSVGGEGESGSSVGKRDSGRGVGRSQGEDASTSRELVVILSKFLEKEQHAQTYEYEIHSRCEYEQRTGREAF